MCFVLFVCLFVCVQQWMKTLQCSRQPFIFRIVLGRFRFFSDTMIYALVSVGVSVSVGGPGWFICSLLRLYFSTKAVLNTVFIGFLFLQEMFYMISLKRKGREKKKITFGFQFDGLVPGWTCLTCLIFFCQKRFFFFFFACGLICKADILSKS